MIVRSESLKEHHRIVESDVDQDLEDLQVARVRSTGNSQLDCSSLIDLLSDMIEDLEIDGIETALVDENAREFPDTTAADFLNGLAYVGVKSLRYVSVPKFAPHSRNFFMLVNQGDFEYEGEVVEEFVIPNLGAEKLSSARLGSLGVASPSGVLASAVYTDVIDAVREKLDGEEAIVYTIRTRKGEYSFYWDAELHYRLPEAVLPGQFEIVDGELYFLSGYNSLAARVHKWQYLSDEFVYGKDMEGLIVRLSGKEYRVPWRHSATLQVRGGVARDKTGTLSVRILDRTIPDGLYDFLYNKDLKIWEIGKKRRDKIVADGIGGINEMLNHAAVMSDLLKGVPLSAQGGETPSIVQVVPMGSNREEKNQQSSSVDLVKIRVSGGFKNADSYRRILLTDLYGKLVSTYAVTVHRSNVVVSCGRVSIIRRHESFHLLKMGTKYYTTNYKLGIGFPIIVRMKKDFADAIMDQGPCYRLYEVVEEKYRDVVDYVRASLEEKWKDRLKKIGLE